MKRLDTFRGRPAVSARLSNRGMRIESVRNGSFALLPVSSLRRSRTYGAYALHVTFGFYVSVNGRALAQLGGS